MCDMSTTVCDMSTTEKECKRDETVTLMWRSAAVPCREGFRFFGSKQTGFSVNVHRPLFPINTRSALEVVYDCFPPKRRRVMELWARSKLLIPCESAAAVCTFSPKLLEYMHIYHRLCSGFLLANPTFDSAMPHQINHELELVLSKTSRAFKSLKKFLYTREEICRAKA